MVEVFVLFGDSVFAYVGCRVRSKLNEAKV